MTWTKNAGVYIINKQFMQKSWKVVLKWLYIKLFSWYSAAEMIYVNWSYLIFFVLVGVADKPYLYL